MNATLKGLEKFDCLDEAELITRVQKGDTEAFTPIVNRYRERIYKLIYRWVRHHETAEGPLPRGVPQSMASVADVQGRVFNLQLAPPNCCQL